MLRVNIRASLSLLFVIYQMAEVLLTIVMVLSGVNAKYKQRQRDNLPIYGT